MLFIVTISYISYFTHLSLERWDLMLSSLDYARIDNAIYNTTIGKFMWTNDSGFNYWKQHIAPILLFFSAFYMFSDAYWVIFFVQTFTIGAAAIPLFLIAKHFLKNEYLALLAVIAYLCSGGLQMGNLYDYHMLSHEPLFLFSAFYAMLRKRWGWYCFFIALLVICKEDSFILASMVALYAALGEKEYKPALYTWLFCGVYAIALFKIGYPYLRQHETYQYYSYYSWLGDTPLEIVKRLVTSPIEVINGRLENAIIFERWKDFIFQNGLILPLLSPLGFIMLLPPSMELFLSLRGHLSGLTHHYPLLVVPIWSLATILALSNVLKGLNWASDRLEKVSSVLLLKKMLSYILSLLIIIYSGAIIYFVTFGEVDYTFLSFRVRMEDLERPLQIFFLSIALFFIFTTPRPLAKYIGKNVGVRAVFIILVSLICVKLYSVKEYGALPVYSSWATYLKTIDKRHALKVEKAIKLIPNGAKVITNPGAFAHIHHNTEAYISLPGYRPSIKDKNIDFLLLDMKDAQNLHYHQMRLIHDLLLSRSFGAISAEDGVFVFKKGFPKKIDYQSFIDYFTTSSANGFPYKFATAVGENVKDTSSSFGASMKATQGKTAPGHLVYGPYIRLYRGEYKAIFRIKANVKTGQDIAILDVVGDKGNTVFADKIISGSDFDQVDKWKEFELNFKIESPTVDAIELRVYYMGGADLFVDMTRIEMSFDTFTKHFVR
ncbi:hypothetical protein MNBD_NITROSPINAE03-1173 [hydrothermal vent metagenome]|uniref:Uncharacterized protein n=1 Tax=hydrothermal vent metagenome TaxID=652676 RepID=A0A3B1CCB1_9ZZZZ